VNILAFLLFLLGLVVCHKSVQWYARLLWSNAKGVQDIIEKAGGRLNMFLFNTVALGFGIALLVSAFLMRSGTPDPMCFSVPNECC
jgi:hypothetical protein